MKRAVLAVSAVCVLIGAAYAAFTQVAVNGPAASSGTLFPVMGDQASSVYPLQTYPPGVTYNGGIPARTTQCGATLSPLGGGMDDTPQIQAAINACPTGQVVQLGSGVFVIDHSSSVNFGPPSGPAVNHITIQGVGPGPGGAIPDNQMSIPNVSVCGGPCTILYKNNWQSAGTVGTLSINAGGSDKGLLGTPISLSSDAVQGTRTITLSSTPDSNMVVGKLTLISILTADASNTPSNVYNNQPDFWLGGQYNSGCAPACYEYYSQIYREMQQWVKITSVAGNVITVESPLSFTYSVASQATLVSSSATQPIDIGIKDIYFYGGGGGHGNAMMELCQSCWISHIESHWAAGGIGMEACYRCEVRDSYLHENGQGNGITGLPVNGGDGYLISIDFGTANSLVENNILWVGDKAEVMRGTGGGNVIAYNYADDQWDVGLPQAAEAGMNAGHYVGSHFETIEGNRSHRYSGDAFWGNSPYITVFRNWFLGIRGGYGGLAAATIAGNPWCDCFTRAALQMQAFSYYHNIVGNVFGVQSGTFTTHITNQSITSSGLLNAYSGTSAQTNYLYEWLNTTVNANTTPAMYVIGNQTGQLGPPGFPGDANLYQKVNRQGNFDYVTNSQIWYAGVGGSGTTSTGPSQFIPNSLYLPSNGASQPAFFSSSSYCPCIWPWVEPATGATHILPAKARFDAGTPNVL